MVREKSKRNHFSAKEKELADECMVGTHTSE